MRKAVQAVAEAAGALLRGVRIAGPGIAGAMCVVIGLAMIYDPLGLLAAGAFLLLIDYRRP